MPEPPPTRSLARSLARGPPCPPAGRSHRLRRPRPAARRAAGRRLVARGRRAPGGRRARGAPLQRAAAQRALARRQRAQPGGEVARRRRRLHGRGGGGGARRGGRRRRLGLPRLCAPARGVHGPLQLCADAGRAGGVGGGRRRRRRWRRRRRAWSSRWVARRLGLGVEGISGARWRQPPAPPGALLPGGVGKRWRPPTAAATPRPAPPPRPSPPPLASSRAAREVAALVSHDMATLAAVADALKLPGNPNLRHELTQASGGRAARARALGLSNAVRGSPHNTRERARSRACAHPHPPRAPLPLPLHHPAPPNPAPPNPLPPQRWSWPRTCSS
jgi:hypothetical protein